MRAKSLSIDNTLRSILLQMEWIGNVAKMPPLDRKTYEQVNAVLELAGGKWNRSAKAHIFDEDGQDKVAQAIETGAILDAKKTFQFFPTPPLLAARMVTKLQPDDEFDFILEPSAGHGALVAALLKQGHEACCITALELNPEYAEKCSCNTGLAPLVGDFMQWSPSFHFNRIIMNPPFHNGQDVDHVTRAFSLLAPGGRLVAITAPSWEFRTNNKFREFRQLVRDHGESHPIEAGVFQESGTDIRTNMVILNK